MTNLTLADRVRMMHAGKWTTSADLATLLADIAAADRLARADWTVFEAALRGEPHSPAKRLEYETAMDAYRARMAQGVTRG